MNGSGGGRAVAGGVGFQQRVGGVFLALTALQFGPDEFLRLPKNGRIRSIRFETADAIDDICFTTENGASHYCQIKRTLSLSNALDSEFAKAIKQFIQQFTATNAMPEDAYLLIVSPSASRQIINSLQRVVTAVRESPTAFDRVPFNQREIDSLSSLRSIFTDLYLTRTGHHYTDEVFALFCQKMHVVCLDVERHGTFENAVVALLASRLAVQHRQPGRAWSIWHNCISTAADFGSARAVVAAETIQKEFATHFAAKEEGDVVYWDSLTLQCGLEVLLVESFIDGCDYVAADMFRFNEDGSKRVRFSDGRVEIGFGHTWARVCCRSATWEGLWTFLTEHSELLAGKSLSVIEARLNGNPNLSPAATKRADELERMLKERSQISHCIHCGKTINESIAPLIEVDEDQMPLAVGATHRNCVRPTDRICGRVEIHGCSIPDALRDFDLALWARSVVKGQNGLRSAIRSVRQHQTVINVLWTAENLTSSYGAWCVRIRLSDGGERYVTSRGRIERMRLDEANEKAAFVQKCILEASGTADPFCYSESGVFGNRRAVQQECDSEEIANCNTADIVKYSTLFERGDDSKWYAPLCFITERHSDKLCVLSEDAIPLLSNPLEIVDVLDNWRNMGINVGDIAVHSMLTDAEFDLQCKQWLEEGFHIVVDPRLNAEGQLAQGIVITDLATLHRSLTTGSNRQA